MLLKLYVKTTKLEGSTNVTVLGLTLWGAHQRVGFSLLVSLHSYWNSYLITVRGFYLGGGGGGGELDSSLFLGGEVGRSARLQSRPLSQNLEQSRPLSQNLVCAVGVEVLVQR